MELYQTKEKKIYKVYEEQEMDNARLLDAMANSDYYNCAYEYAKERNRKQNAKGRRMAKLASQKYVSAKDRALLDAMDKERVDYLSSIAMGFDIEFTKVLDLDKTFDVTVVTDARSYMYHWQFAVNDCIITGRKWCQFESFMKRLVVCLEKEFKLAMKRHNQRFTQKTHPRAIIWVANLPCEFQFIKDRINWASIFATDVRKVMNCSLMDGATAMSKGDSTYYKPIVSFQDCLRISGGSLASLAKDYTTTQKLKGDLDYTISRNSQTPLTEEEKHYCYNDVAILSEWHQYYYNTYSKQGYAPSTMTGILRHEVKRRQTMLDLNRVYNMMPDAKEYKRVMQYLFKGGYAHANVNNAGTIFENCVYSWDITSSYPYVMLVNQNYPMGAFVASKELEYKLNNCTKDNLYDTVKEISETCRFYANVEIKGCKSKSANTYISLSKCLNKSVVEHFMHGDERAKDGYPMTLLDNGRIKRTIVTKTVETDLDILTILEMYDYKEITFSDVKVCEQIGALPKYLTEPIEINYEAKSALKKKGLSKTIEYVLSKIMINAGFGMCCTRAVEKDAVYDITTRDWITEDSKNADNLEEQLFLNPYWGIWVTSFARRRLMEVIIKAGNNSIVSDTDSIYSKYSHDLEEYINSINDKILIENKKRFNNNPLFDDLGCWDKQSTDKDGNFVPYEKFCTMGAKRYVLYGWNDGKYGWKQTIAGLPKKTLKNFCDKHNKAVDKLEKAVLTNNKRLEEYCHKYLKLADPYNSYKGKKIDMLDVFCCKNGFVIPKEFSGKTTTKYHNTDHYDLVADPYGNEELMYECSSMSIYEIEFSMRVEEHYLLMMEYVSNYINTTLERRAIL